MNNLDAFLLAACDIAADVGDKTESVAVSALKRYLPRAAWSNNGKSLRRLKFCLDAAGIGMVMAGKQAVQLWARNTRTGMLDQAIRIRRCFDEGIFGPQEYVSRDALFNLGNHAIGKRSDRAGALAEALEQVGFSNLGVRINTRHGERLLVTDAGVTLRPKKIKFRLAKARHIECHTSVPGDEVLHRHFPEFAEYTCAAQRDAIHCLLGETDSEVVIARLPTGFGKSLLYLLPSAEWRRRGERSTSIVISPVVALQNDQTRKIREHYHFTKLQAAELNSTVPPAERTNIYRKLRNGQLDVLFLAPERLVDPFFQEMLISSAEHIRLLVVDEAHMVAEWGQDFRTDFFRLGVVRNRLRNANPHIQTLLQSATLTEESERILLDVFHEPATVARFEEPSLRPELSIRVIRHRGEIEPTETLIQLLPHVPTPCIIYCARTKHVRELRTLAREKGIRRFMDYMGTTAMDGRVERLEAFHNGDVDFVFATNAFGLGVDKADVRTVIHFDVPRNLDEYYQQIGRAARDHWTGHAILLDRPASRRRATKDKRAIIRTETASARAQSMLDKRYNLPADGVGACLLPLHDLAEHIPAPSALNRNWNFAVLNILEQVGDLDVDRAVLRTVFVRRGSHLSRLNAFPNLRKALRPAIRKARGGQVDLARFARAEKISFSQLERELVAAVVNRAVELVRDDHVDEQDRDEWVLVYRRSTDTWTRQHTLRLDEHRQKRLVIAEKQRRQLIDFLSRRACRMNAFESVYGYHLAKPCGHCDVCNTKLVVTDKLFS